MSDIIGELTMLFTQGYDRGHDDTINGEFTNVVRKEKGTYFQEHVQELLEELPDLKEIKARLAALKEENERLKAQVASLVEATDKIKYIDGLGASRNSPVNCRDGIRYVTVDDTIYWPLSEEDAQLLRSAECGRGEFTGPSHRLITAVSVPDEEVAKMFHENYEKLAPSFGYETREETRKDWEEVPQNNKALMIAVIKQIRLTLLTPPSHNVILGVGDGHGNLFVHGDYDSIKAVQDKIFELEKLRTKLAELEKR